MGHTLRGNGQSPLATWGNVCLGWLQIDLGGGGGDSMSANWTPLHKRVPLLPHKDVRWDGPLASKVLQAPKFGRSLSHVGFFGASLEEGKLGSKV